MSMAHRKLKGGRLTSKLLDRLVRLRLEDLTLRELRLHAEVTQTDLAGRQGSTQADVSRTERRDNHLVSTVRRYVEALGGELELHAKVGKARVKLDL